MGWVGTITDAGNTAIETAIAMSTALNINGVKAGSGTVSQSSMHSSTSLASYVNDGILSDVQKTDTGVKIRATLKPHTTAFVLKEVGIYATVGETAVLLFLAQNADGIEIPAKSNFPDFAITMTSQFSIGTAEMTITVDPDAYVATSTYENGMALKADKEDTVLDTTLSRGRKANTTTGIASLAFGYNVEASGNYSQAIGSGTKATAQFAYAEGYLTEASGLASHSEGNYTFARGAKSHAEGHESLASGDYSHAEGNGTTASGNNSHAEGQQTTASASYSHSEGYKTTASGFYSHAEGNETSASASGTHAEGNTTIASGNWSHAEGSETQASGDYSHAQGRGTIAQSPAQHVMGKYNIAANDGSLEIVGGGTADSNRVNMRKLDSGGNERLRGDVYVGCNIDSTMGYVVPKYQSNSVSNGGRTEYTFWTNTNCCMIIFAYSGTDKDDTSKSHAWVVECGGSVNSVPKVNHLFGQTSSLVWSISGYRNMSLYNNTGEDISLQGIILRGLPPAITEVL